MAKKTAEEYQELLYEEKLDRINEKVDEILVSLVTKASSSFVNSLNIRVGAVEELQKICPVSKIDTDVKQLKKDRDTLMDATDDIRFYKRKPEQFKILIIGIVFMLIINLALLIYPLTKDKLKIDKLNLIETTIKKMNETDKSILDKLEKE